MDMADTDRIRGSIPPLVTPFANGEVDYATYARLVEFHVDEGSHGKDKPPPPCR